MMESVGKQGMNGVFAHPRPVLAQLLQEAVDEFIS